MRSLMFGVAFAVFSSLSLAQPQLGKVEASFSASYQNIGSGGGKSSSLFYASPRVGFFPAAGLEIEPELVLMTQSQGDPVYMLNANLAYNFKTGDRSFPFLLIGYGIANTVPVLNVPSLSPGFSFGVFNAGGGVKSLVAGNVALRVEYRFQKFTGEEELTSNSQAPAFFRKVDTRIHTLQFGLSVFF